jgi:hypothetical protein
MVVVVMNVLRTENDSYSVDDDDDVVVVVAGMTVVMTVVVCHW